MAIKFEKIKPGMRLMDIHIQRIGNTTMGRFGRWFVDIISVDEQNKTAVVRRNGNKPTTYYRRALERLYTKEPKRYRDQQERRRKGGLR